MLKNSTLRLDKLEQDSIDEKYNDIVLGFIQKNNKDNWYSIEVTFEYKPVIKDNCISLEIKYSYDNIGDAGCDATPEEIKLVKNIIYDTKKLKAQDIDNIATWCHYCGEHGLKIVVKIQPDNG